MKANELRELASKIQGMVNAYNEMADKLENNEMTVEMEDMYIGKILRIYAEIEGK